MRILALDLNRGREEGEEADKIISFYGTGSDVDRMASAGLVEGLLSFSSSFDRPDEDVCGGPHEVAGLSGSSRSSGPIDPIDPIDSIDSIDPIDSSDSFRDVSLVDVDKSIWVIVRTSSHPNIVVCLMMEKSNLSRHVTERNILGLGRLMNDLVSLFGLSRINDVVLHIGKQLENPLSRVRRQLRNPFASTYGASRVHLPVDVDESLRGISRKYGVEYGLWYGGLCAFSCFQDVRWLGMLGSFVLGQCVELQKEVNVGGVEIRIDGNEIMMFRENEYVVFVAASDVGRSPRAVQQDAAQAQVVHSGRAVAREASSIVSDLIRSKGGWHEVDTRHVGGSRYCVEDTGAGEIICSPRGKVSASSHHVRSMATTLANSLDSSSNYQDNTRIYTCDKTGGSWACYTGDEMSRSVSVTLGGLSTLDVRLARRRHAACVVRSLDHRKNTENRRGCDSNV